MCKPKCFISDDTSVKYRRGITKKKLTEIWTEFSYIHSGNKFEQWHLPQLRRCRQVEKAFRCILQQFRTSENKCFFFSERCIATVSLNAFLFIYHSCHFHATLVLVHSILSLKLVASQSFVCKCFTFAECRIFIGIYSGEWDPNLLQPLQSYQKRHSKGYQFLKTYRNFMPTKLFPFT